MDALMMAKFLSFLSVSVLDLENWESFRGLLERKMIAKCKFYFEKVVQYSENI